MRLASFRSFAALIALVPLAAAAPAFAQGEAQQLPPSTAPTQGVATPQVTTPVALPVPNVTDPMLVAVPPAEKVVTTWREALALLRARSTDLRTAYDEVVQAEAQQRIALSNILTQINGSGALNHQQGVNFSGVSLTSTALTNGSLGLTAQQTLFNYENFYAIGTARAGVFASRLTLEDLKRTLALGVANALVGVVTAERVAELNRSGLQQALERLNLTVQKVKLGASGTTGLDVVRAQQDVESARTTLVSGDESLREARESLGLALGIPDQVGVTPTLNLDALEADAHGVCRQADSIDERADIRAARQQIEVAHRKVNDVWYQFLPTLNAQGGATEIKYLDPSAQATHTWNIEAVLTVPIWDGGQRYGELHNMRAAEDMAVQTLESDKRQAQVQVIQAKRNVAVAQDELRVADRARALAIQNDEMTQTAYRGGLLTSLDLVTAAAARRQAEINYALQQFTLVKNRIAAVLALATCNW
jgi:multidrug efflux system outer membrane protein